MSPSQRVWLILAGVIALGIVSGACARSASPAPSANGGHVLIASHSHDPYPAAADLEAHRLLLKAIDQNDRETMSLLLQANRIFTVRDGDALEVLDHQGAATQVRLTSGESSGRVGWLPDDVVSHR